MSTPSASPRRLPLPARLRRAAGARAPADRRRGAGRSTLHVPGGPRHRTPSKLKAYELQENGLDTVEANIELGFPPDAREYGIGSQILSDLGLSTIRILTNNPRKITGIEGFGLKVVEQVPIEVPPNIENQEYLETKRDKLGHRLHHQEQRFEPLEIEA